jgi:type 1 fimbria pilin
MVQGSAIVGRPIARTFSAYSIRFASLASGASGNGSIQIQADTSFEWTKAAFWADIANAAFTQSTQPFPNVGVQILDTGTGRNIFDQAIPVPTVFGTPGLPYILPVPYTFAPRSSIAVSVANFDAAVTYDLWLIFQGYKIFQQGN